MSEQDGRKIDIACHLGWMLTGNFHRYVGAVDGIYEFHVDIQARKFNPSIELR